MVLSRCYSRTRSEHLTSARLDTVIYHCYNRDSMDRELANLWTIDELGQQVARALSVGYEGQSNSRVRDVPDRRTIRYYTTLGLIDRATRMCGRTALYGRRHPSLAGRHQAAASGWVFP